MIKKNNSFNNFFVKNILIWGKINKREFLWRRTKNPYDILIAEVLLQRTKAKQVEQIYAIFMDRYPTIYKLYNEDEMAITKMLIPLGLKKRGKALKQIAQIIVKQYEGNISNNKEILMTIPFIGNYTSDAILCHAYNEQVATYDSNFARVINNFFNLSLSKPFSKDPKGYSFAQNLIKLVDKDYNLFNLAIIDFASAICLTNKPKCSVCPLKKSCCYYFNSYP